MKILILLFLSLVTSENNPDFNAFINTHYKGGSKSFLTLIYKSLRYPEKARNNCIAGELLIEMEISGNGSVNSIRFLNELGMNIEEAVEQALILTEVNWKEVSNKRSVKFSIAF